MPKGEKVAQVMHQKKVNNQEIVKSIQEVAKENLIVNVRNKVQEVSEYISDALTTNSDKTLSTTQIFNVIANRSVADIASITVKSYTPQEIGAAFNLYIKMITEINKYTTMPPSKASFCMLLGISLNTYNNYLQTPEMCDVMNLVETYITGAKLTAAQLGEIKEISTIFDLKSQHGFMEAQAPTTIIHEKKVDVDDIRLQLMEMKRGKAIDATYEEKN